VYGQCEERSLRLGIPDLDCAIPAAAQEGCLVAEVPVDREDLAAVFRPAGDGKLAEVDVEELDTAVSTRRQELVLVRF
jgi:hypothetical protein